MPRAIFLIDLIQDVTVLRPLIFMATRNFGFETLLLVSTRFPARDRTKVWRKELAEIAGATGASIEYFQDTWDAQRHLAGHGLMLAGSESSSPQHRITHELFLAAPPQFLRVTIQHGFECLGFNHSADHVRAHGETATFAADLVCAWSDVDHLPSLAPSQRPKLLVTGPTSLLQMHGGAVPSPAAQTGLVCENLHSVRFAGAAELRGEFVATLSTFAKRLSRTSRSLSLRTHPGGQFAVRNELALPANVELQNAPLYRVDLRRFAFGIAAPSSVLVDLLLAGVPTAVWRDRRGLIDASSYEGLHCVSSAAEWIGFVDEAERNPARLLDAQRAFLAGTGMPLDPTDVFWRFSEIFRSARRSDRGITLEAG